MCEIQNQPTPYHVGYLIGPRINAGGRVGKSFYGAELLMSNNSQYVYEIATKLNDYNNQRKEIEKEGLSDILDSKNNFFEDDNDNHLGGLNDDPNKLKKGGLHIEIDENANIAEQDDQAQQMLLENVMKNENKLAGEMEDGMVPGAQ